MRAHRFTLPFALALAASAGCATTPHVAPVHPAHSPPPSTTPPPEIAPPKSPEKSPPLASDHEVLFIRESNGQRLFAPADDSMLDAVIGSSQVLYLGERHDDPHVHRFERELVERAVAMQPKMAIGFEMLPVTMQSSLDAYVAGRITEAQFLTAVDWQHTWGFSFDFYRPLFELCRDHKLRAYALNAPAALAKRIAHGGIESLSDEEKGRLPVLRADETQFRHFADMMRGEAAHGTLSDDALGRYYLAQLLWDETMAQSVADALFSPAAPPLLVVIAGDEHARRFAVPARARRRGVHSDVVVLPVYQKDVSPEAALGADFLWVLKPRPVPQLVPTLRAALLQRNTSNILNTSNIPNSTNIQ